MFLFNSRRFWEPFIGKFTGTLLHFGIHARAAALHLTFTQPPMATRYCTTRAQPATTWLFYCKQISSFFFNETVVLRRWERKHETLLLSNEFKVELTAWKICKADFLSVSPLATTNDEALNTAMINDSYSFQYVQMHGFHEFKSSSWESLPLSISCST